VTSIKPGRYRNRAATDILEPGSEHQALRRRGRARVGQYTAAASSTRSRLLKVGVKTIEDEHPLGPHRPATILAKSRTSAWQDRAVARARADVGHADALGFGQVTASGYPGESAGLLSNYSHWRPIGIATMSYGYGLSVTPLQLAHAYATIGAEGVRRGRSSFLRVDGPVAGERVLDERTARTDQMLEAW
jgi:cell division protein FtsI (penicillin-binding protein 3)